MSRCEENAPYYEQITNKLIEQIEAGTALCKKP
jgi:DNA-binding transcriptional regulator YhcF (GntR family)